MEKYAYATLLSSNGYIAGIIGLKYSLEKSKCKYPLVVIVTDDISQKNIDFLEQQGVIVKLVKKQLFENTDSNKTCINKIYAFGLSEWEKILFLDADCIVIHNIDFLFNYKPPIFSIALDVETSYKRGYIWGGAFLIEPSVETEEYLFSIAQNYLTIEEILNDYFQNFDFWIFNANFLIIHDYNQTSKYWREYKLYDMNKIKEFIDNSTFMLFKNAPWIYKNILPYIAKK